MLALDAILYKLHSRYRDYGHCLKQDCSMSIANPLEIPYSCGISSVVRNGDITVLHCAINMIYALHKHGWFLFNILVMRLILSIYRNYISGLVREWWLSALALEIQQSCTKSLICHIPSLSSDVLSYILWISFINLQSTTTQKSVTMWQINACL